MKRDRSIIVALMLLAACLLASPARGQGSVPGPASQPAPPPRAFTLTVSPAAQPEPALRYLLLPDLMDTPTGNAALLYHMAMEMMPADQDGNLAERIANWLDVPADKLPRKEIEDALGKYGTSFRQMELAARRDKCDWDLPARTEGISLILPPLSKYRALARASALRARLHAADGNFDAAVHDLQTGYAMARHVAEGPTLIESLVGIAVAGLMNSATQELAQAKGGPNLYWAIASLPRPFISLRRPLDFERSWILLGANAGILRKAAYGERLTDQEIAALPAELGKMWESFSQGFGPQGVEDDVGWRLALTASSIKIYPLAKNRLAKLGYTPEQIEKMPIAQVVAMQTLGRYLYWRDELNKWQALPYPQAAIGMAKTEKALGAATDKSVEEGWPFTTLLPSISRAGFVAARLDRQLGAMMAIEAVRLYAAAHDGKAPAGLDEMTDPPALPDPITGKPFQYQRTEDGFVITCPNPPQFQDSPSEVYKVTLRK